MNFTFTIILAAVGIPAVGAFAFIAGWLCRDARAFKSEQRAWNRGWDAGWNSAAGPRPGRKVR